MNALLDTHTFLWFIAGSSNLSATARQHIEQDYESLLSIASLWEIAIKTSIGKLTPVEPFEELITSQLEMNGISTLGIDLPDVAKVVTLPFHHRDPFDRLLIAQAMNRDIPIISLDSAFDAYPVTRLW